jgi:hypothetical protein
MREPTGHAGPDYARPSWLPPATSHQPPATRRQGRPAGPHRAHQRPRAVRHTDHRTDRRPRLATCGRTPPGGPSREPAATPPPDPQPGQEGSRCDMLGARHRTATHTRPYAGCWSSRSHCRSERVPLRSRSRGRGAARPAARAGAGGFRTGPREGRSEANGAGRGFTGGERQRAVSVLAWPGGGWVSAGRTARVIERWWNPRRAGGSPLRVAPGRRLPRATLTAGGSARMVTADPTRRMPRTTTRLAPVAGT